MKKIAMAALVLTTACIGVKQAVLVDLSDSPVPPEEVTIFLPDDNVPGDCERMARPLGIQPGRKASVVFSRRIGSTSSTSARGRVCLRPPSWLPPVRSDQQFLRLLQIFDSDHQPRRVGERHADLGASGIVHLQHAGDACRVEDGARHLALVAVAEGADHGDIVMRAAPIGRAHYHSISGSTSPCTRNISLMRLTAAR